MNAYDSTYTVLDAIRERPSMYVGKRDLRFLSAFLHGFWFACEANQFDLNDDPDFRVFHDFVAEHYDRHQTTAGWCTLICDSSPDSDVAVTSFYSLLDSFRAGEVSCPLVADRQPHHVVTGKVTTQTRFPDGTATELKARELPVRFRLQRYWKTESCYLVYEYNAHEFRQGYYLTLAAAQKHADVEFGVRPEDWRQD